MGTISVDLDCGRPNRMKLCDTNCITCKKRSIASSEKFKFYSSKNDMSPSLVCAGATKEAVWWDCDVCFHTFQMKPHRFCVQQQSCPYCNSKKLCGKADCSICYNKSVASDERIYNLIDKSQMKTDELLTIHKKSNLYLPLKCNECGHCWDTRARNITVMNTGCPNCSLYCAEITACDILKRNNILFNKEVCFAWSRQQATSRHLRIDFILPEHNVALELDGIQHFNELNTFNTGNLSLDERERRDFYKMDCVISHEKMKMLRYTSKSIKNNPDKFEKWLLNILNTELSNKEHIILENTPVYKKWIDKNKYRFSLLRDPVIRYL